MEKWKMCENSWRYWHETCSQFAQVNKSVWVGEWEGCWDVGTGGDDAWGGAAAAGVNSCLHLRKGALKATAWKLKSVFLGAVWNAESFQDYTRAGRQLELFEGWRGSRLRWFITPIWGEKEPLTCEIWRGGAPPRTLQRQDGETIWAPWCRLSTEARRGQAFTPYPAGLGAGEGVWALTFSCPLGRTESPLVRSFLSSACPPQLVHGWSVPS